MEVDTAFTNYRSVKKKNSSRNPEPGQVLVNTDEISRPGIRRFLPSWTSQAPARSTNITTFVVSSDTWGVTMIAQQAGMAATRVQDLVMQIIGLFTGAWFHSPNPQVSVPMAMCL